MSCDIHWIGIGLAVAFLIFVIAGGAIDALAYREQKRHD